MEGLGLVERLLDSMVAVAVRVTNRMAHSDGSRVLGHLCNSV